MSFKGFYKTLTEYGLDSRIAKEAAYILSKDDPTKEDFGRTKKDKQVITIVWLFVNNAERERRNQWANLNQSLTGNGDNLLQTPLMWLPGSSE